MDQLPYDDLDNFAKVLQTVYTGDTTTVKQAEEILRKMGQNPTRFIDSIVKILTSEKSDPAVLKVKKAASLIALPILNPLFERSQHNTTSFEVKAYVLEGVLSCVFSNNVLPNIKASFQQFLSLIFHGDTTGELKQKSLELAKSKLGQAKLNDYAGSLYTLHAILDNPTNSQEVIANWFQYFVEDLVNAGKVVIQGIGEEIQQIIQGDCQEVKVANVFMGLEVLKVWTLIIAEFIKRLGKNEAANVMKAEYIDIVIEKEDIGNLLLKMISLQIPTEHQIKGCLLSTSAIKPLDELLNCVKANSLRCFTLILDLMVKGTKTEKSRLYNARFNKLYVLVQVDVIKAVLQSLFTLSRSSLANVEQRSKEKYFHECLTECLVILSKLTQFNELYPLFADHKNMIIMDICLPLCASTKEDLRLFVEDPQTFVNLTSNLEEELETQNAKIQALQLLKKLCENIDGATSSLVMLIGMLIDFTLVSNDLTQITEQYPKLSEFKESLFLNSIEPRIRVETCLLVLAGVNEFTLSRPDLLQVIDALFTKYHEYFLGPDLDPLIKSRMCLFLASYASYLFKRDENKELYAQHLKFLIVCAGLTDAQQQTVADQANESLYDMLAEKAHVVRMMPYVTEILEQLIAYTTTTKSITFFDVLHEILRLYAQSISKAPHLLIRTMTELVNRGQIEYEFLKNDKGIPKMALNKIWNLIKIIGEKKDYLPFQEEYEKVMIPMFSYILSNEDLPFDDDLLSYVNSTTKLAKRVSTIGWEIFKVFPKILERYQNLIVPIFPALNQIIVYGREQIDNSPELKAQLLDMGIKAFNTTHPDAGEAAISLVAVFYQLLIQYIGIPNEDWERMLAICLEKLKIKEYNKNFIKARIGGVFLLAFLRNFEITQACLLNQGALGLVMELFVNHAVAFDSHVYDRKVFIISLSNLLNQQNIDGLIVDKLPQILDILVSYLGYIQLIEHKKAVQGNKKVADNYETDSDEEEKGGFTDRDILRSLLDNNSPINPLLSNFDPNDDDDDEEEDDDEEDDDDDDDNSEIYFPTEKDEANYYVTHLVTDIKAQDEFAAFRDAITKLKQNNQQLLAKLATSLPERKKQLMKDVLQSQRVVLNPTEGKTQARKMVKTAARKVATLK